MSASVAVPSSPNVPIDLKVVPGPGSQRVPAIPRPVPTDAVPGGRRRRQWVLATLIALVIAAVAGEVWRASHVLLPVHYLTAPVSRGTVARAVTASGTVNPVTTVQVGTYVSGVIRQLFCDYNTPVKTGQLCARIDPRPYQTVVDQEQANLATAKAQLMKDQTSRTYAKLTYDRTLNLLQRGLVTQDAADSAKSTYDQAQAQVDLDNATTDQHRALLNAATINLDYTNIVSPVNGTVVSRNVTMGQTVAASFQTPTLFLIATDLTNMRVDANVSESDIGGVKLGDEVSFTVEAFPDRTFHGHVVQVRQAPQSVQNVITYDVVISAPNPGLLLKPGMTATTRIVTDQRTNVVRVPDQALRYTPGGLTSAAATSVAATTARHAGEAGRAWIVRNGRPTAIAVTIGLDDDAYAEITGGDLAPGDAVIVTERTDNASGTSSSTARFFRL